MKLSKIRKVTTWSIKVRELQKQIGHYLTTVELFALAHRLVEEHLDEDHVDRAVDNGRYRGHQVKIFVFAVAIRIWKN